MLEEKKVLKICLTGGPCAGKTSSLRAIQKWFSSNFKVLTVPEIATLISTSGINLNPSDYPGDAHKVLTNAIINAQLHQEALFEPFVRLEDKRVMIVCDRGTCDNFGYTNPDFKPQILKENSWDLHFLSYDRYDMVIHLVTVANGAEKYYNSLNNSERWEGKELAKQVDWKTQKEWMGHPNFCLIDNSKEGFSLKEERILNVISGLVGDKTHFNHVKEYLIDDEFTDDMIPKYICTQTYVEIQQKMLKTDDLYERIACKRKYDDGCNPSYLVQKINLENVQKNGLETVRIISEENYEKLISLIDKSVPIKHISVIKFVQRLNKEFKIYHIVTKKKENKITRILKVIRDCPFSEEQTTPSFIKIKGEITKK